MWQLSGWWSVPIWELDDLPLNVLMEADQFFGMGHDLKGAAMVSAAIYNNGKYRKRGGGQFGPADFMPKVSEPMTVEEKCLALFGITPK